MTILHFQHLNIVTTTGQKWGSIIFELLLICQYLIDVLVCSMLKWVSKHDILVINLSLTFMLDLL